MCRITLCMEVVTLHNSNYVRVLRNVYRCRNVVQLKIYKEKSTIMTACQIKKALTVWNNRCEIYKYKKSPNIRPEGLFRNQVCSTTQRLLLHFLWYKYSMFYTLHKISFRGLGLSSVNVDHNI